MLAFVALCGSALLGSALAIRYMAGASARSPPAALPPLHGALGAAGLCCLIVVLRHGLPESDFGTASFGPIAAVLLGLALAIGLAMIPATWRRHRPLGALVGAHAGLAVAGLVMLLTLVALR